MKVHKNIYLFFYFVLGVGTLNAQTVHFSEDFEGTSGTTPPTGWTIEVVSGDTTVDNWHFNNPAGREFGKTYSRGQFAIFDDSYNSGDGTLDTVDLVGPAVNLQGKNKSKLYFFEYFEGGFGGKGEVYYRSSSASSWVKIYEISSTSSSNPNKIGINLQGYGTSTTSQFKFRWIGNDSFWWIIDDVYIYDNPAKDAGALSTNELPGGCVVSLSTPFGLTAKNFGSGNLSSLIYNYQLNNDTIVTDTVTFFDPLKSDSTYTHVFDSSSQPNFVEGFNELKLWTSEPGATSDQFTINDTIYVSTTLSKLQVADFPFYEDFEDSVFVVSMCGNLGASGNGRIDIVSTDVFPSCEGGNMVVMDANRPASTIDNLDLLVDLSSCVDKTLTFTYGHVNDEKDPEDALYISVDNGGSFIKIYDYEFDSIPDSSCYTITLNLDSIADTMGFSLTPTSLLRWKHAGNDSIGSGDDGFYIDDIQIDLAGDQIIDAGISDILFPDTELYIDSNFQVTATIKNYSSDTVVALNVHYQLGDGPVNSEFWAGCLAQGDEATFTFTNDLLTDSTIGIFPFCVWTSIPNSIYMTELDETNDTMCVNVEVRCSPTRADFGWGVGCVDQTTQFTDESINGTVVDWFWDFGDGNTSTGTDPVNTYTDTGDYTVWLAITDDVGCTDTIAQIVPVFTNPVADFMADTVCLGTTTQFYDLSDDADSWDWDFADGNTDTIQNPTNLYTAAGTYQVRLKVWNLEGCNDQIDIDVIVNDMPIADAGADQFISSCTATVNLLGSASSGTPSYTYWWSNGVTTANNDSVGGGSYLLIVTDNNGCADDDTVDVIDLSGSTLSITTSNDTVVCFGTLADIWVQASGGTTPYKYEWSTGETTSDITVAAGNYSVKVTDNDSCSVSDFIVVDEYNLLTVDLGADESICNGDTIILDAFVDGGDGNYNYSWNTGATTQTIQVGGGTFAVTVTDGTGCTSNDEVTITENSKLTVDLGSDSTVCYGNEILLTANVTGGDGNYTYWWDNGAATSSITDTITKDEQHYVDVTDGIGCWAEDSIDIFVGVMVDAGPNQGVTCSETSDLLATVDGGFSPFTYFWNNGITTANNDGVSPGTYSVEVTDGMGCTHSDEVKIVLIGTDLSLSVSDTVLCEGISIQISPDVTGGNDPYSYLWNTGATTSAITVSAEGDYFVEVTDSVNCKVSGSINVSNYATLTVNISTAPTGCSSTTTNITANASGGDGNYSYSWNTGETTAVITKGDGIYIVDVSDIQGCNTATDSITISGGALLSVDVGSDITICLGNTVSITAVVTGGDGSYSYSWNTGETTASINKGAGTYIIDVTDGMGCSNADTINVTVGLTVNASFDQSADTIDLKLTNTVTFVNTSTGSSSWNWDFGNSSSSTDQNPTTVYINTGSFTVTLISSDGSCSDTAFGKVVVINTTGFNENQINTLNFEIYPNPTNRILTLKINKPNTDQISINIFNILGEKVNVPELDESLEEIYEIDVTGQHEGVYFLQIVSDNKNVVKKFVINR